MEQEVRFITVEIHDSAWQAHVCRALLESENIPAYLRSEHHIGLQWSMSRVLGGVRVAVPVHLLQQAQSVLAERDKGTLQQALEHDYPSDTRVCKSCGGTEFQLKTPLGAALATFLMLWLWSTPYPPRKEHYCKQCGAMAP